MFKRFPLPIAAAVAFAGFAPAQQEPAQKEQAYLDVAILGIGTRAPAGAEVQDLGLEIDVKVRGQVVTEVEEGGAAEAAGISTGDVVLRLGKNEVFSRDDIADFLVVSKPGQRVEVAVLRRATKQEEVLSLTLGKGRVEAPKQALLVWQYASLGQLADALATAKKQHSLLLIGLSGAET